MLLIPLTAFLPLARMKSDKETRFFNRDLGKVDHRSEY